ncbi:hypothetical protein CC78DRAFT_620663 [Lojkania enalia]|uniref:Uncharacterized protein n=1 Tax=Lojkania enalia TaxID=147567 RepID=A0A9P4K4C4_9PLEO|nr:hypothetical protein CC78DRAFT_620663 [Didymosphaeria enalia]
MQFKSLLAFALAGAATADFAIITTTEFYTATYTSFTRVADYNSWVESKASVASSAVSTYLTSVTAQPEYTSYVNALSEFVATRSDAPDVDVIMATTTTTTYTSVPAWFQALPSDVKDYIEEVQDEQFAIVESVVNDSGAMPTGAAKVVGGVVAAAAAAGAALMM